MAVLARARVTLSGAAVVGPSVATHFYAGDDYDLFVARLILLWEGITALMPTTAVAQVPQSGELIDSGTGDTAGVWTSTTVVAPQPGDRGAIWASGVGGRIVWETAGRTNNRRVRGSTFVVPVASDCWGAGTFNPAITAPLRTIAGEYVSGLAGDAVVWSRGPAGGSGVSHVITSALVPNDVSWLRSRRT